MVEKFLGKSWSVRYYRNIRTVEVCSGDVIVWLMYYDRTCDAADAYASIKTVGDIRRLLGEF